MGNLDKVRQGKGKRRTTRSRPSLEWLEHRVTPSTFHVNTLLDTDAVNLKTGKDSSGHVSLRSAIMAANAHGGSNKIILPAGTFTLTLAPTGVDDGAAGELDIKGNVTIQGRGAGSTIIDGNNLDRVIQVQSGSVSITGVTIQHGLVEGDGGGILNSGGRLTLSSVVVKNNEAIGAPGSGPAGNGGAGEGGGIFNAAGSLSLVKTTIASNQAIGGAGTAGVAGAAGTGNGQAGQSGGSGGTGEGGGIFNAAGATLTINGTTLSGDQATGGEGAHGAATAATAPPSAATGRRRLWGRGPGRRAVQPRQRSLTGAASTFTGNNAFGGAGGQAGVGGAGVGTVGKGGANGGTGGTATGGNGGLGGDGGDGQGGGIWNGGGATLTNTTSVVISSNNAAGGASGNGALGGRGTGGAGGDGLGVNPQVDAVSSGGLGGFGGGGVGGNGGFGGIAGLGQGGGLFNDAGGTVTFRAATPAKPPAASTFTGNLAPGGAGGPGGASGSARGGTGGQGANLESGGQGGSATGGIGGGGGDGNDGDGGGLFNAGTVSFTGVTVNLSNNKAQSGFGGAGGAGGARRRDRRLRRFRPLAGQRRQRHRRHRRRQRRGRRPARRRHLQRKRPEPSP